MKARFLLYSLISLLPYICISCTEEDNKLSPISETLTIHLDMGNSNFSRAISEAEEQYDWQIEDLHVFIFDADGNIVLQGEKSPCYWHFEKEELIQESGTVTLMTGNWKNVFRGKDECGVYVVANLYEPKPIDDKEGNNSFSFINDLSWIATLDELKGLTDQNFQIYQPISDSNKLFTMSGCIEKWEPASSPNIYTLSVPLTRLAARIEVNIEIYFKKNEIEQGYRVGIPQFELVNYTTKALVLSGNDDTFSDRAWTSDDDFSANQSTTNQNQFVAYTYPNEWNSDILHETYVLVNVPFIKDYTVEVENNYYKVPLRLSTDDKRLERNHWYKIKAIISSKGNIVPDKPVELTDVHYEVAPWNDMNIDINGDTPMYLELSEYDVVMRNVDTYDLTFASSSQIAKPENENEKADINIKEIYYYNKNGKKINITDPEILDNTYLSVEGSLNGNLVIHSPIPENKTIRYITLTVKNTQYKEDDSGTNSCIKTVTIKQYPLEYITGISGLCSYLENSEHYKIGWPTYNSQQISKLNYTGGTPAYTFNGNISSDIIKYLDENIGEEFEVGKDTRSVDMKCKFYVENESKEGRIFRIDESYFPDNSSNNLSNYVKDNGSASNNQMYHVVITSTSDQYKLARPPMTSDAEDATVVQNSINNDFVSPSFMLASQLGNSSVITWDEAQTQCQHYVEVGNNDIPYNDWRLPTLEEIKIIKQYQEAVPDVMDAVLETRELNEDKKDASPYYWTAIEDVYHYTGNATDETDGKRTECRVRCVRDFHVGEPTE